MTHNTTTTPQIKTLVRNVYEDQPKEEIEGEFEDGLSKIFKSDAIIDYGLSLAAGRSKKTTRNYLGHLAAFEAHLTRRNVTVVEATPKDVRKYADTLAFRGRRVGTIDIHLQAIKSLYSHLEDEWGINTPKIDRKGKDYAARVPPETERKAISREKVRRLIEAADCLRNTVIVGMFYYTGLRRAELSDLDIEDVTQESNIIKVWHGKGNKPRSVPYAEELDHILTRWLEVKRPTYPGASDSSALFLSKKGGLRAGRLGSEAGYEVLMEAAKRAGLEKVIGKTSDGKKLYRVTPHILRHSIATHMVEDGVPLHYIQRILGHSSIQTTLRYAKESEGKVFESYHTEFNGI